MGIEQRMGNSEDEIILGILSERNATVFSTKPCPLSKYRQVVSALSRPSNEQIDNFVRFVSEAHSWYKHLPLLPPGAIFQFFVDPFSGTDRILQPGGKVIRRKRTQKDQRIHYTWMTTREYRSRFSYLSYESAASPRFFLRSKENIQEYADLPTLSTSEGEYRIPPEVAQVGSVELTAVIHPRTAELWVWEMILPTWMADTSGESPRKWPTETGGDETLQKIIDRVAHGGAPGIKIDAELDSLLLPERQRLHKDMKEAINRVLDLLYGNGNPSA